MVSKPPVASIATTAGASAARRAASSSMPAPLRATARKHVNVELVLRDVDADDDGVHPVPSLSKRASHAAQGTVRVRWNDGRGPSLTHGLDHPRGLRSRARHRTGQNSRSSDSRLTRAPAAGQKVEQAPPQPPRPHPVAPSGATRPLPFGRYGIHTFRFERA